MTFLLLLYEGLVKMLTWSTILTGFSIFILKKALNVKILKKNPILLKVRNFLILCLKMRLLYRYGVKLDAPRVFGVYLQDSGSSGGEGIGELHNNIMYYLIIILLSVGWLLLCATVKYIANKAHISYKYLNHGIKVPIQKYSKETLKMVVNLYIRTFSIMSYIVRNLNLNAVKVYENDRYISDIPKSSFHMLTDKNLIYDIPEPMIENWKFYPRPWENLNMYSNSSNKNLTIFYQWLSGLIDGGGSFIISYHKPFIFLFSIEICIDINKKYLLYLIQQKIGIGKIHISGNKSKLIIVKPNDISLILKILGTNPLQSRKYLNYLFFKRALELYNTTTEEPDCEMLKKVYYIQKDLNKEINGKSLACASAINKIIITPYWLVGFVEAKGLFFRSKKYNNRLIFSLTLSIKELALLREIQNYLYMGFCEKELNYISIVTSKRRYNSKRTIQLIISREDIINYKLIPYLESINVEVNNV